MTCFRRPSHFILANQYSFYIFWPRVIGPFSTVDRHNLSSEMKVNSILTLTLTKNAFTRHLNDENHKIQIQITEIGWSWRAGCDVSHAFYCISWLLFYSPVTEALAMTRKVMRTKQFNLSPSSRSKHLCRSCSYTMVVSFQVNYEFLCKDYYANI